MASYINTNISSLNSQRALTSSQGALASSLQRLSSGLRINSAKDDAAGLAISERMTSQIRGLNQATRNANDGISLAQTAEGDMVQIGNNLQRMRELAVQSANASNSGGDRSALDAEFQALSEEIDRVASNSQFNGVKLLDGSFSQQKFQIGANATAADSININSIASARTSALGQYNGFASTSLGAITDGAAATLTMVLNKTSGPAQTITVSSVETDAKSIAAAINSQNIQGLTATAQKNEAVGSQTNGITAGGTDTFTLNGQTISVVGGTDAASNRANALKAINDQSAVTGVVAKDTGNGLTLTAADGRNIEIANFTAGSTGGDLASYGLVAAGTTEGTVKVEYQAPAGSNITSMAFSGAGMAGTTTGTVAATGKALSAVDIKTADAASGALASIDAALGSINSSRASLGAVQNRFNSVISSLQTTSENLSASRSRIQDADFAAETANLTRAQILQQAGTAMLAQANSVPNGVLSLLRG
ncbi:MAG TPA: flagellin [Noviherbaspirillum sp.]|jgi:flagellin|uniref:flagellin N-terminal helical domain-containing protein n=1 Tax=Noviherbaspirillum sp. TaxID=1926288 RepID=UPI002F9472BD